MKKTVLFFLLLFIFFCNHNQEKQIKTHFQNTSPELEQRDQPADSLDLQILTRAKEILSDSSVWDKNDDRLCGENDTEWSLFCALQKASYEILGEYQHRRVALQEVRFAIDDVSGDKEFMHRLMDFNNTAAFQDLHRVLQIATERVSEKLSESK